jgi:SSS family solute:Na+ symporter
MNNIFFQYYSIVILVISALVMVTVSMMTAPPSYEKISGLTFGTLSDEHRKTSRSSWTTGDVAASIVVVLLILAAYLYFTG